MNTIERIGELWVQHSQSPLPEEYRLKNVGGYDALMLDADVAGWMSSFLKSKPLDCQQTTSLQLRRLALEQAIDSMEDYAWEYYSRLIEIIDLVVK